MQGGVAAGAVCALVPGAEEAAPYCAIGGAALAGYLSDAVYGAVSDFFSASKTFDCSYFSANYPDVPLTPAENAPISSAAWAKIDAQAMADAQAAYDALGAGLDVVHADGIRATIDHCFPMLGGFREGYRVAIHRKILAGLKVAQADALKKKSGGSLALPLALGAGAIGLGVWAWKAGLFK